MYAYFWITGGRTHTELSRLEGRHGIYYSVSIILPLPVEHQWQIIVQYSYTSVPLTKLRMGKASVLEVSGPANLILNLHK